MKSLTLGKEGKLVDISEVRKDGIQLTPTMKLEFHQDGSGVCINRTGDDGGSCILDIYDMGMREGGKQRIDLEYFDLGELEAAQE